MTQKICCFIGCAEQATVEISGLKGSDDCNYSCDQHIGKLKRDGNIDYSLRQKEEIPKLEDSDGICQNEECSEPSTHSVTYKAQLNPHTISTTVTYVCEAHIEAGRQEILLFHDEPDGINSQMFLTELPN